MHDTPTASVHVKRPLASRELFTIAIALAHLAETSAGDVSPDILAMYHDDDGLLSNDAMRALAGELTTARKVKVCRSKR